MGVLSASAHVFVLWEIMIGGAVAVVARVSGCMIYG